MSMKKSAATLRAEQYKNHGEAWFGGFTYTEVKGIGYEKGVHRRDPSSVLEADGIYYVWYTKSLGPHFGVSAQRNRFTKIFPWDYADIWYAVSEDGINWEERGCAVPRGEQGDYDERTVCTPDVMEHKGKYYMVYQTFPQSRYEEDGESVGLSVADNPNGPWKKHKECILTKMQGGEWFGSHDNYNDGAYIGLTHDPSLFYYIGMYYLYYKCGASPLGSLKSSGQDTRWGVAVSGQVTGPYVHSEYNPVTNSGHETMLWEYKGGIAALLNRDGPEKDTIQYAKDGVNFEIMSHVYDTPMAGGAFRGKHNDEYPLEGIRWGLCHCDERSSDYNYLMRFDLDNRHPYAFAHQYPGSNVKTLGWW